MVRDFHSYTHSEAKTAGGQRVKFTCAPNEKDDVAKLLAEKVRTVEPLATGMFTTKDGMNFPYSRYNIKQHDYSGYGYPGNGGYWEVLEIQDPPDGRHSIVLFAHNAHTGNVFTVWKTIKQALAASRAYVEQHENLRKLPGFIRQVDCGDLSPWFFAVGEQALLGDFAFPEGFQNDPVYKIGQKFVVLQGLYEMEVPTIKTCMGATFEEKTYIYGGGGTYTVHTVYWDDGTNWCSDKSSGRPPRPLEANELWITEAISQFRELLAGNRTNIEVNFANGGKFTGKVHRPREGLCTAEGRYLVAVSYKKKGVIGPATKTADLWYHFIPTSEALTLLEALRLDAGKQGAEIETVVVKESRLDAKGRRWNGVFYQPSSET